MGLGDCKVVPWPAAEAQEQFISSMHYLNALTVPQRKVSSDQIGSSVSIPPCCKDCRIDLWTICTSAVCATREVSARLESRFLLLVSKWWSLRTPTFCLTVNCNVFSACSRETVQQQQHHSSGWVRGLCPAHRVIITLCTKARITSQEGRNYFKVSRNKCWFVDILRLRVWILSVKVQRYFLTFLHF